MQYPVSGILGVKYTTSEKEANDWGNYTFGNVGLNACFGGYYNYYLHAAKTRQFFVFTYGTEITDKIIQEFNSIFTNLQIKLLSSKYFYLYTHKKEQTNKKSISWDSYYYSGKTACDITDPKPEDTLLIIGMFVLEFVYSDKYSEDSIRALNYILGVFIRNSNFEEFKSCSYRRKIRPDGTIDFINPQNDYLIKSEKQMLDHFGDSDYISKYLAITTESMGHGLCEFPVTLDQFKLMDDVDRVNLVCKDNSGYISQTKFFKGLIAGTKMPERGGF